MRAIRRGSVLLLAAALAFGTAGQARADTPLEMGYQGDTYFVPPASPTDGPGQSKLWFTDGTWWADMFYKHTTTPVRTEYRIWRIDPATHQSRVTPTVIDARDLSHADTLWDEAAQRLYVASGHPKASSTTLEDRILVRRFAYTAATDAYTELSARYVPATDGAAFPAIARDSAGRLWLAWSAGGIVRYSRSMDDGLTWSAPAQLPSQPGRPAAFSSAARVSTAIVAFGSRVGIMWVDGDALPTSASAGVSFASVAAGDDPGVPGSWTLDPELPVTVTAAPSGPPPALDVKVASDGTVYAALGGAPGASVVLRRTPAGSWTGHPAMEADRLAQIVLDEELGVVYLFGGGNSGASIASAPLAGPDALVFQGPATAYAQQAGSPYIDTSPYATDGWLTTATTRQAVSHATGLALVASGTQMTDEDDLVSIFHNETPLPASDVTPPVGTVTPAFTFSSESISIGVPATDAGGSGVSLVRLANAGTTTGGLLDDPSARTFAYGSGRTPAFTITGGSDGPKAVWAQWRDAVGNWSVPVSGSINLDTTPPTGTLAIEGGAASATSRFVTLTLAVDDGTGSGPSRMLVANDPGLSLATPQDPFQPTLEWRLAPLTGDPPQPRTVYVKVSDAVGNASILSDDISLAPTDLVAPTTPGVPRVLFGSGIIDGSPVRATWAASADSGGSGLRQYDVRSSAWPVTRTVPPSRRVTVLPGWWSGRVTVRAVDGAGNESPAATSALTSARGWSEAGPPVTYAGRWGTSRSGAFLDGAARYSVTVGSSVSFRFTGRSLAIIGRLSPTSGRARVYVNGVYSTTIDLAGIATQDQRVIYHRYWPTSATRTVRLVLAGPATRPRVTIDGFWVLR